MKSTTILPSTSDLGVPKISLINHLVLILQTSWLFLHSYLEDSELFCVTRVPGTGLSQSDYLLKYSSGHDTCSSIKKSFMKLKVRSMSLFQHLNKTTTTFYTKVLRKFLLISHKIKSYDPRSFMISPCTTAKLIQWFPCSPLPLSQSPLPRKSFY